MSEREVNQMMWAGDKEVDQGMWVRGKEVDLQCIWIFICIFSILGHITAIHR